MRSLVVYIYGIAAIAVIAIFINSASNAPPVPTPQQQVSPKTTSVKKKTCACCAERIARLREQNRKLRARRQKAEPPPIVAKDIADLPKLPDDIDPNAIPPFFVSDGTGRKYHYSRPLTPQEREVYYALKSDPDYKGDTPPLLKISAIRLVRKQKLKAGALDSIQTDLIDGRITKQEAEKQIAEFYEKTR